MDHHFPGTSHLAQLGSDLGNFEARSGLTVFVEHLGPFLRMFLFFFFLLRDSTRCPAGGDRWVGVLWDHGDVLVLQGCSVDGL